MNLLIFIVSIFSITLILVFSLFSVISRDFEFFPPPSKNSWQYRIFWLLFRLMFLGLVILSFSSFNTLSGIAAWLRFFLGLPLLILGFGVATYLSIKLGWENAHGEKKGLVVTGWYRWSRNPIYVASLVGMFGWGLFVNSGYVYVILFLWAFLYVLSPFFEEPWLQKRYVEDFSMYKDQVPRFVGLVKKT
jgi:protein-S-isoprenylcysteine O-methyltransferase Ste14